MHEERSRIYTYVFNQVLEQTGKNISSEKLAKDRVVNAVNKAVNDWEDNKGSEYSDELIYLFTSEGHPIHFEFNLKGEIIESHLR